MVFTSSLTIIVVLAMVFGSLILIADSVFSDIAAILGGDPSAILEELFSSDFLAGDSGGELGTKVISLDSKGLMVTVKVGISKAGS